MGKSIVGGDQNISNTSVYNQDETKSVRRCAVSGRQAEVTRGYVCPSCSLWVHGDHFDRATMRCDSCRQATSKQALGQFEAKVTQFLGDSQISREELMELRGLGTQLGLSNTEQDSAIAKLKQQLVRGEAKGLSILDKTKLKAALRQLTTTTSELDAAALEGVWSNLKILHRSNPSNVEIATLMVVGLAHALQGRGSIRQYRELHEALEQAEALGADSAHKYLVHYLFYRLARQAGRKAQGDEADFLALAGMRHHAAVTQLENSYSDTPECYAVQLATLLEDYYTNGGDAQSETEVREFALACAERLSGSEVEEALRLVRQNCSEGKDLDDERAICPRPPSLAHIYFKVLFTVGTEDAIGAFLKGSKAKLIDDKLRFLKKAAELNHAEAQIALGDILSEGKEIVKDEAGAVRWFLRAAESGNAIAQNRLGFHYKKGLGVPQSDVEAVKWYKKAADNGSRNAFANLGVCYLYGEGVDTSYDQAALYFKRGAESGVALAQQQLGDLYESGKLGVEKDYAKALYWMRKAAEQGYGHAQGRLGWFYQNGKVTAKDMASALYWFGKAAEQGDVEVQRYVAELYEGGEHVDKDYIQAAKWYLCAAEKGDSIAQHRLGNLYCLGRGVRQDFTEAVSWFRRSAEQGNVDAQRALAAAYEKGQGVTQDNEEAKKWLAKANEDEAD
jgi:TPR repeat protein